MTRIQITSNALGEIQAAEASKMGSGSEGTHES